MVHRRQRPGQVPLGPIAFARGSDVGDFQSLGFLGDGGIAVFQIEVIPRDRGVLGLQFAVVILQIAEVPIAQDPQCHAREEDNDHERSAAGVLAHIMPRPTTASAAQDRLAFEVACQVIGEITGRAIAGFRLFAEAFQADSIQVARGMPVRWRAGGMGSASGPAERSRSNSPRGRAAAS